jgi:hypothetical protein
MAVCRRRLFSGWLRFALCVWAIPGWPMLSPAAAPHAASEYQVKAAFLLNFTKFVEWPPEVFAATDSPFTICLMGKDPFARILDDMVAGEAVNGRRVAVRRMSESPSPRGCQVVFIGSQEKESARILGGLGRGVLTVGEGEGFIRAGGIIAFVVQDRRVRFDIAQSAAEGAALKLSSQLLAVARSVIK